MEILAKRILVALTFLLTVNISIAAPVPTGNMSSQPAVIETTQVNNVVKEKAEKEKHNAKQLLKIDSSSEDVDKTDMNNKTAVDILTKTQAQIDALNDVREQAKFLYNSNKSDESFEIYKNIPDVDKNSEDYFFMANIMQDKAKMPDAIFYLKKAIQSDEKNYKAHYNLGNIYYSDGKYNMALSEYRKVLRIKNDFSYAYYNKGCCYLMKKSLFNAKYEFGLAIKANPQEPAFYYNLAYTYKLMNKPQKAKDALSVYTKLMSE